MTHLYCACCPSAPELIMLIFAVLYVSWTKRLTRCYKTEFSYIYINICSFSTVFYHISVSDAHKAQEKTCARVFVWQKIDTRRLTAHECNIPGYSMSVRFPCLRSLWLQPVLRHCVARNKPGWSIWLMSAFVSVTVDNVDIGPTGLRRQTVQIWPE